LFSSNGFKLADDASFLDTGIIDSTSSLKFAVLTGSGAAETAREHENCLACDAI
jgi:hypothetical protein